MTRWKTEIPTEEEEQKKLARYLDMNNFCWCHVPNEGKHKVQYRAKQKKLGLKSGVPDVLIFDAPENVTSLTGEKSKFRYKGVTVELKRQNGSFSDVRESQAKWLEKLEKRGWLTKVCFGADEAINWLKKLFKEDDIK